MGVIGCILQKTVTNFNQIVAYYATYMPILVITIFLGNHAFVDLNYYN